MEPEHFLPPLPVEPPWCCTFPRRGDGDEISDTSDHESEKAETTSYVKGEQLHFVNPDHRSALAQELSKQRDEGRFMDCTVKIGAGPSIPAHRLILAAISPYFDGLLRFKQGQELKQEDVNLIDLSNLDAKAVELLIDYVYRGEVKITLENVRELLRAADFLCISTVSAACVRYLSDNLDVVNCFPTLHFAASLNNCLLVNEVKIFLARHFPHFIETKEFCQTTPDFFMDVLRSDELVATERFTHEQTVNEFFVLPERQEELVVRLAMRYVSFDAERKTNVVLLCQILSEGARLPLIPLDVLKSLRKEEMFAAWPDCIAIIEKAIATKIAKEETAARNLAAVMSARKVVTLDSELGKQLQAEKVQFPQTKPRFLSVLKMKLTNVLAGHIEGGHFGYGDAFDDSHIGIPVQYVTGMKMYRRNWDVHVVISGLLVTYNNGNSFLHGSDRENQYPAEEFTLEQDERITGIHIQTGWMIDGLKFTTSHGRVLGPYGGKHADMVELPSPCASSAYLAHLKGRVQQTEGSPGVRHIQFGWAYNSASTVTHGVSEVGV